MYCRISIRSTYAVYVIGLAWKIKIAHRLCIFSLPVRFLLYSALQQNAASLSASAAEIDAGQNLRPLVGLLKELADRQTQAVTGNNGNGSVAKQRIHTLF